MKLLVDESVDGTVVRRLRREGYAVHYVAEMDPGISDVTVLLRAHNGLMMLITEDKDFGDLVFHQHQAHSGVILMRLDGSTPNEKAELLLKMLTDEGDELFGVFSTLTEHQVRIRRPSAENA